METKINQEIRNTLKQFEDKYFIDGIVNKQRVIQDLYNYDSELIETMLNNDLLKENFTMKVADTTIFQINNLIELFEADEFWKNSYTKYSKKIGLTAGGKFIDEFTDVVLDFPYKDTVLKASMSKEDSDKDDLRPEEPFLNEVIAKEEIDVLLDKKIFVNAKRYNSEGEEVIDSFNDDNLIVKGNNLLALHTLKEKYAGKVKLIYIDPPYNTGGDAFNYNDRFNHSTWLTFIKNRLEIAYDLLCEEGSIWITLDDNEASYTRVLLDQLFGENKYITTISWKHSDNSNNNALVFSEDYNSILVYAKSPNWKPKFLNDLSKRKHFKNPDQDPRGPWFDGNPVNNPGLRPNLQFDIKTPNGNVIKSPQNGWRWSNDTILQKMQTGEIRFSDDETRIIRRTYLNEMEGLPPSNLWINLDKTGHTRGAKYEQKKLFPEIAPTSLFSTPKPELLLQYILELSTEKNDIVLDFFMGSSTTQAVAMKMNRKFIGIEQMDYVNTISIPRLQKVIEGEQGGISKEVSWQGGGSFVYAELMEKNTGFLKSVISAKSMTELQEIFNRMLETADFEFQVDLDEVRNTIWQSPIDHQKRTLVKIIDKNQLYYNYSEIDDINVRDLISDTDYAFNQSFYAERGE